MIYVLIPAYNNKKEVLDLLECLNKQSYNDLRIILVDDGSSDNTESEVRTLFPDTVILKGNGNLWWTGANVMGVNHILNEARDNDFILLLNNDLVVKEDYIETLVTISNSKGRAITGSASVDYNNHEFIESGIRLSNSLDLIVNRDNKTIDNTAIDLDVDVLPGRGTLVPVEVFRTIGNFNQNKLPHYGADYEFSIRAKRAGFKLIVSNKARVYAKFNLTGLKASDKKIMPFKECFSLLFSKKSKSNIYYYLNYVWLCSEKGYKMRNLLRNAKGILSETVGKTLPGYPFKIIFSGMLKICSSLSKVIRSGTSM